MPFIEDELKRDIDILANESSKNYPPERLKEIRELHLSTFRWEGERIPLALLCADPQNSIKEYPGLNDPRPFLQMKVRNMINTVRFSSDLIPTVSLDYFGDSILPSMVGCKIILPERGTQVVDAATVGPWIKPIIHDIEKVDELEMPSMDTGLLPVALEAASFFREHLPANINVATFWKIEPFTLAELLRGPEIYTDFFDYPEEIHRLLDFCTELFIRVEKEFRKVTGHSDTDNISHWGIVSPGIRLNGDTIINLSPDLLREFVLPQWKKLADAFGGPVYPHYCSTHTSKGLHLFKVLGECPWVAGLSTQIGVEYYIENYNELYGRFLIESGYTGANAPDIFHDAQCFETIARKLNEKGVRTGMILSYTTDSYLRGKAIMDVYRQYNLMKI
ncbi:MAG: uroporphyrinogen decarboxylase family protein [Bacillota bacterium]